MTSGDKKKTGLARGLTNYGDPASRSTCGARSPSPWATRARCSAARSSASPTSRSGFNNCHRHFPELIEAVKRGVLAAGGLPLEFPDDLARRGVPAARPA